MSLNQTGHPPMEPFDIFIIGGGINGCGIARDAAGRGYRVGLCEAKDLGGGTSSASTKLIHGGLRYLEYYEFRLVHEALKEREILWALAPHIIHPLRFVLPLHRGLRPAWLIRLGLFMYDYMGGRKLLPPTKSLNLDRDPAGMPLKPEFARAFEYSDCWVEDSRLVVLNARDAADKGARIFTHTRAKKVEPDGAQGWRITLEDTDTGAQTNVQAKLVVNAAGPWVDEVLRESFGRNDVHNVRLVRGSHIVIRKKYLHDKCYIFQNSDNRIIFAIPYENDYTLIGTTDAEQQSLDQPPAITPEETRYLCDMASEYFREPVKESDIVWTYSGVRPLYDDGASSAQEATRDYVIETEQPDEDKGPLLTIFGGKITTYRRLAEAALADIERFLPQKGENWTRNAPLPGGDFPVKDFETVLATHAKRYGFLDRELLRRMTRHHGTNVQLFMKGAKSIADMGTHFGAGLYAREIDHFMDYEWARTAADIAFRRTRLGIRLTQKELTALDDYMSKRLQNGALAGV